MNYFKILINNLLLAFLIAGAGFVSMGIGSVLLLAKVALHMIALLSYSPCGHPSMRLITVAALELQAYLLATLWGIAEGRRLLARLLGEERDRVDEGSVLFMRTVLLHLIVSLLMLAGLIEAGII